MNMLAFLRQICVLLAIVAIAYLATKKKVLKSEDAPVLTRLISWVTLPFTMLSAVNVTLTPAQQKTLPLVIALFVVFYLSTLTFGKLLTRPLGMNRNQGVIFANGITFTNGIFIGLPLLEGVFGSVVYLYVAVVSFTFSLIFFTYSVSMMQPGRRFCWKDLLTPCNVSTLVMIPILLTGATLPPLASKIISTLGSATTPLSLVVIGIMLASSPLKALLGKKPVYLAALFRNLLLPLLMLAVLRFLPLDSDSRMIIFILYACPTATLVSVFAKQYELEADLAGQTVLFSTMLSAVTLPLMAWLGQMLLSH